MGEWLREWLGTVVLAITGIGTIALACYTAILARATARSASASEKMADIALRSLIFEAEPAILLSLDRLQNRGQVFNGLTIANTGKGPAYLEDLSVEDEKVDGLDDLGPLHPDNAFDCPSHGLAKRIADGRIDPGRDFSLAVRYSDSFGHHWAKRFTVRLRAFAIVPGRVIPIS